MVSWEASSTEWFNHQLDVSKNRGTRNWMIYNGKPLFKMDDLGGKPTIFGNSQLVKVTDQLQVAQLPTPNGTGPGWNFTQALSVQTERHRTLGTNRPHVLTTQLGWSNLWGGREGKLRSLTRVCFDKK